MTNYIQGWWTLSTEGVDLRDLPDSVRQQIADSIRDGNIEGQIFEELSDQA